MVVDYGDGEGIAIVEFDSSINPEYIGDYGEKDFHTVVTVFEPDTVRYGEPFDYIEEELLNNPNNRELPIKKEQSAKSADGEKIPSTKSELFFKDSITENDAEGNAELSFGDNQTVSVV